MSSNYIPIYLPKGLLSDFIYPFPRETSEDPIFVLSIISPRACFISGLEIFFINFATNSITGATWNRASAILFSFLISIQITFFCS